MLKRESFFSRIVHCLYPLLVLGCVFLVTWVGISLYSISQVEIPEYVVIDSMEKYEIREYRSFIVAATKVESGFDEAKKVGYERLAGFMRGKNYKPGKQDTEQIGDHGPVMMFDDENGYEVSMIMPSKYIVETLPRPVDERVVVKDIPKRKFAVSQFDWWVGEELVNAKITELERALEENKAQKTGEPISVVYDVDWVMPFFMRNEIWIPVN